MTRHVLFLDFDGVLHPASSTPGGHFAHASKLADCIQGHSCEVVVSSSWRHSYPIEELKALLPDALSNRIIETTGTAVIGRHARFHEIQAWIKRQVTAITWRALDDCGWEFPTETKELILCDANTGLTRGELRLLSRWLRVD